MFEEFTKLRSFRCGRRLSFLVLFSHQGSNDVHLIDNYSLNEMLHIIMLSQLDDKFTQRCLFQELFFYGWLQLNRLFRYLLDNSFVIRLWLGGPIPVFYNLIGHETQFDKFVVLLFPLLVS
jgi:hypothetical protein